jgi:hypothetical protein
MNDKLLAHIFGFVAVAACCIGVPALIIFLGGLGLFAWFASNSLALFALALIVAAGYLLHRDRRKRRRLGARRERAVEYPPADAALPSTPYRRYRSPGK